MRFVIGITGASGMVYAFRLVQRLVSMPNELVFIVSKAGFSVLEIEIESDGAAGFADLIGKTAKYIHPGARMTEYDAADFTAPPASGSFPHDGMVVVPCSMNTMSAVASGRTDNLIHRAADVCLKEKRPLVLCPRETPLNRVHLKNMLDAQDAGAVILPLCPGFYFSPKNISDLVEPVVDRIMSHLGAGAREAGVWGMPEDRS